MGNAQYGPVGIRTVETHDATSYRVMSFPDNVTEEQILEAIREDKEHIARSDRGEELGAICLYAARLRAIRQGRGDLVDLFELLGADPKWVPPENAGYLDERGEPLA